jgi:hypothetical protein
MPDALILATADLQPEIETVLCADGDWAKIKGLSCKVELLKVDFRSMGGALPGARRSRVP